MNLWLFISIIEFLIILILVYYLYKFGIKIIETEDSIDNALDILEEKYEKISSILEIPVFFDSVEVRQVVNDIYECQKAIYKISVSIGSNEDTGEEIDSRQEED